MPPVDHRFPAEPEPIEPPGPGWKVTDALVVWLVAIFGAFVSAIAAFSFGWLDIDRVTEGEQLARTVAITGSAQFLSALLALKVLSDRKGSGNLKRDFRLHFQQSDVWALLWGLALAFSLALILGLILIWLDLEIDSQDVVEAVEESSGAFERLAVVGVTLLLGPFVEELVFRGVLHDGLRRRFGVRGTAWIGGIVFGVVHLLDPSALAQVPFLAIFGVIAGYVRERTGSLARPILMHIGFNSLAVIAILSAG